MKKVICIAVAVLAFALGINVSEAASKQLVLYVDQEYSVSYEEKYGDEIVKWLNAKMPKYADTIVVNNPQAALNLTSMRAKEQAYLSNKLAKYPEYEAINPGSQSLMSDTLLQRFLSENKCDGLVIIRLKTLSAKLTDNWVNAILLGAGGKNTVMEFEVSTIIYTAKDKQVFNKTQTIKSEVSGSFAPMIASKRAVSESLDNIGELPVVK